MITLKEEPVSGFLTFAIDTEKGKEDSGESVVSYTVLRAWQKIEGNVPGIQEENTKLGTNE